MTEDQKTDQPIYFKIFDSGKKTEQNYYPYIGKGDENRARAKEKRIPYHVEYHHAYEPKRTLEFMYFPSRNFTAEYKSERKTEKNIPHRPYAAKHPCIRDVLFNSR